MARALVIEEESGTTRAVQHPHNGYYAGDFSTRTSDPDGFERALINADRSLAPSTR